MKKQPIAFASVVGLAAAVVCSGAAASVSASPAAGGLAQVVGALALGDTPVQLCLGERGDKKDHDGNGQRGGDGFDPYGKDDPNGPKWSRAAGPENRYGGLGNRTDAGEKQKAERDKAQHDKAQRDKAENDRADRERERDNDDDR